MVEGNAVAETKAVATVEDNAKQETPKVDIQAEITKLSGLLEQANKAVESERKNVSKKENRIQELSKQQGKIDNLEARLEVMTSMLADIVDRGEVEEEPQKQKRSDAYLSKIPKPEIPKNQLPEDFVTAASEADKLAKSVGLDMESSDELAKAYGLFMRKNHEKGLEEVKKVVEQINKAKEETSQTPKKKTVDELTDADKAEIARQYMEKQGKLTSDAGGAIGKGMNKNEAYALYAKGQMSEADAVKHGLFK